MYVSKRTGPTAVGENTDSGEITSPAEGAGTPLSKRGECVVSAFQRELARWPSVRDTTAGVVVGTKRMRPDGTSTSGTKNPRLVYTPYSSARSPYLSR